MKSPPYLVIGAVPLKLIYASVQNMQTRFTQND